MHGGVARSMAFPSASFFERHVISLSRTWGGISFCLCTLRSSAEASTGSCAREESGEVGVSNEVEIPAHASFCRRSQQGTFRSEYRSYLPESNGGINYRPGTPQGIETKILAVAKTPTFDSASYKLD